MKKKTLIIAPLSLLLLFTVASLAIARPMGGGNCGGYGGGKDLSELAPEKITLLQNINNEYADKVAPTANKLWMKRTELDALSGNPNVQPTTITKLVEEMGSLHEQLRQIDKERFDRVEKEIGKGYGRHAFGHGMGGMMGKGSCGGSGNGRNGHNGGHDGQQNGAQQNSKHGGHM